MTRTTRHTSAPAWPRVGHIIPGYAVPVINEREARAAAGLLFLLGIVLYFTAIHAGTAEPLKPFGAVFVLDMLIRVLAGDRYAPSLALARIIVARQQPEWVGAPQKLFAWWLGYGMGLAACLATGLLQAPLWVTLVLCGICLTLLFLETAFGICVGCKLQSLLAKTPPQHCAGGTCEISDDTAPASTLTTLPHPTSPAR